MFGLKKLFGNKTITKSLAEYDKIIELEEKRKKLVVEYGDDLPDEIAFTQRDMLISNIQDVAHIIEGEGGLENSAKDLNNKYYFNIQGTSPVIISPSDSSDIHSDREFTDKNGKNKVKCKRTDTEIISHRIEEITGLEEKFIELSSNNISYKAKGRLIALAEKKINKKITEFCELFKGNEQLLKEYIFSGLKGEDDHYHDINTMKERLNFAGLIYPYIKDSEFMEVGPKELMYVKADRLKYDSDSASKLLSRIKNKQYDFIVNESE